MLIHILPSKIVWWKLESVCGSLGRRVTCAGWVYDACWTCEWTCFQLQIFLFSLFACVCQYPIHRASSARKNISHTGFELESFIDSHLTVVWNFHFSRNSLNWQPESVSSSSHRLFFRERERSYTLTPRNWYEREAIKARAKANWNESFNFLSSISQIFFLISSREKVKHIDRRCKRPVTRAWVDTLWKIYFLYPSLKFFFLRLWSIAWLIDFPPFSQLFFVLCSTPIGHIHTAALSHSVCVNGCGRDWVLSLTMMSMIMSEKWRKNNHISQQCITHRTFLLFLFTELFFDHPTTQHKWSSRRLSLCQQRQKQQERKRKTTKISFISSSLFMNGVLFEP